MKKTSILFFVSAIFLLATSCTPAESTLPTTTPEPTGTPLPTSTPIPTATPQPPIAMVGGKMHCFDAPDLEANLVTIINIGMQVEVIGQSQDNLFWLVKADEGVAPCWLETRYTTVINLDNQDIAKIQPTPTATLEPLTVPQAPENFKAEGGCELSYNARNRIIYRNRSPQFEVLYMLSWKAGDRISEYTVYKNGQILANLDGSNTEYSDWFSLLGERSGQIIYSIQAHNEIGDSELIEISVHFVCRAK